MKVLQVVGYSSSGKTTLLEALIKELRSRSFRVGTAKSIGSGGQSRLDLPAYHKHWKDLDFSIDQPNTDTYKHRQAGAEPILSWAGQETAIIYQRSLELWELIAQLDVDFLLIEGGKSLSLPRIVVGRQEDQLARLVNDYTLALVLTKSCKASPVESLRTYKGLEDITNLVDIIVEKTPATIAYQDQRGCRLCSMSCKEMLRQIMVGKKSPKDCLKIHPDIKAKVDEVEKEKLRKLFLSWDKFPNQINIEIK